MTHRFALLHFLFFLLVISVLGCKKKPDLSAAFPKDAAYFSLRQFAHDQYENVYAGQPLVLQRIVFEEGRPDSDFVSIDTLDWGAVLKTFFAADISNRKFLGHYRFSQFDEDLLETHTFQYDAIDPELFTRSMQINADQFTGKIRNIFIKTSKKRQSQNLYYAPMKVIRIEESENPMFGKARTFLVEYRFME